MELIFNAMLAQSWGWYGVRVLTGHTALEFHEIVSDTFYLWIDLFGSLGQNSYDQL